MNKYHKYVEYSVFIALIIAVLIAILDTVYDDFVPDKWFIVGIFSILLTITYYALKMVSIETTVSEINNKLSLNGIKNFKNYEHFYTALTEAVKDSHKELLLTHIRQDPPTNWSSSEDYFNLVEDWAKKNPSGSIKRIGACPNPEMKEWAENELALSKKYQNYYFRVVDWNNPFPHINMAIIDRKMVFIAITGSDLHSTHGIKFHDQESIDAFYDYFQNMWGFAE